MELPVKLPSARVAHMFVGTEAPAGMSLVALFAPAPKGTRVLTVKLTLMNAFPTHASTEQCAETGSVATPATVSQAIKGSTVT